MMEKAESRKKSRKQEKKKRIEWKRTGMKAAAAAVVTAFVCALLLWATGLIGQDSIKDSCQESAEYFQKRELFPYLIEGQFNTRQDNYADCILVNIMYHIEEEGTAASLVRASYYNPEMESVEVSLEESLKADKEPDVDYFRYWHGSMVFLRPLFLFTGIEGARCILGILLAALTLATAGFCWHQKAKSMAVIYLLGNVIVQVWMCFFCIEYITTFLVMNVISLIIIAMFARNKDEEKLRSNVVVLMAISGVITCFVDFLTTETLTVTMPLLFFTVLRYRTGKLGEVKKEIQYLAACGLTWGISYVGMFLLKWLLAVLVLGRQAFFQAMTAAGERIGGTVYLGNTTMDSEASLLQKLSGALFRNQGSLFPFQEKMNMGTAMCLFLGVCFLCFAVVYMLRPKEFPKTVVVLCMILAAVPYLRYLVLGNHAYIHYFFTYRAQLVTVCAVGYCTWQFGLSRLKGIRF